MMARRGVIGLLGGVAAVVLAGCGLVTSHAPFRYRLTVEVETPAGLRSGSSVIEVTAGEVGTTLGGAGVEVRGEAAAIDLPGGQTLFALLRSEDFGGWAGAVMFNVTPEPSAPFGKEFGAHVEAVRANSRLNVVPRHFALAAGSGSKTLPSGYPMLVRFGDIQDPKTVALVNPDDLAASFGVGYRLRRIAVQLTDEPVTGGIEKRLGWLGEFPEPSLNPMHGPKDWSIAATLHHGDFRKGTK